MLPIFSRELFDNNRFLKFGFEKRAKCCPFFPKNLLRTIDIWSLGLKRAKTLKKKAPCGDTKSVSVPSQQGKLPTENFILENYLEISNGLPTQKNSVWESFGSVRGIKWVMI